jgi:hypothetical protein
VATISITARSGTAYHVTVDEGGSASAHLVTVWPSDVERYAPGSTPEALLEASFEFLLAHEPKEAILARFLRGAKGERATPTYFDLKVVGDKAVHLLTNIKSVINDRSRQVFASVKLSDLTVKSFTRQKGEHKGETGYAVKSRLLTIESLAIDGVVVYRRADDSTDGARRPRPEAEPPAASQANGAN